MYQFSIIRILLAPILRRITWTGYTAIAFLSNTECSPYCLRRTVSTQQRYSVVQTPLMSDHILLKPAHHLFLNSSFDLPEVGSLDWLQGASLVSNQPRKQVSTCQSTICFCNTFTTFFVHITDAFSRSSFIQWYSMFSETITYFIFQTISACLDNNSPQTIKVVRKLHISARLTFRHPKMAINVLQPLHWLCWRIKV